MEAQKKKFPAFPASSLKHHLFLQQYFSEPARRRDLEANYIKENTTQTMLHNTKLTTSWWKLKIGVYGTKYFTGISYRA